MKKIVCPRCDNFLSFDETQYTEGQSLIFTCQTCGRRFGIRFRKSSGENEQSKNTIGYITVLENSFGFKQEFPLQMGDNIIGRRSKGTVVQIPVLTDDPSMARQHCVINVKKNKQGQLIYTLRDFPSMTGTFLKNELVGKNERVTLENHDIVSIGACTFIVYFADQENKK